MKASRIILLVLGVVVGLVAVGLGSAGTVLTWVQATQRDDAGFYSSTAEPYESVTAAITTREIELGTGPGVRWSQVPRDWFTVRLEVESRRDVPVFVGIARQRDVEEYLAVVAHDEISSIDLDPFEVTYVRRPGTSAAPPPGEQAFWVAESEGEGLQEVRWDVESGRWAVVVMNADGAPGVSVDVAAGVRTGILLPIGIGLLVAALVALAVAVLLVYLAVRDQHRVASDPTDTHLPASVPAAAPRPAVPPLSDDSPVRLVGRLDPGLNRWLWLVKWFLVIPHLVVLVFLWVAFFLLSVGAFVAIVVTGRYPRGVFHFNVGVIRWTWRVTFYAFTLATDRYPPFTLDPDPDYPASFEVAYPEQGLSRGLVWVKWWLLAIPHYLIVGIFGGGFTWYTWQIVGDTDARVVFGGGLIGLLALIAGVFLLFTDRYPSSLFDFIMGLQRWVHRVLAYVALMSDEYPPFRLDQGETATVEPQVPPEMSSGDASWVPDSP